jgi:hypothetical protein
MAITYGADLSNASFSAVEQVLKSFITRADASLALQRAIFITSMNRDDTTVHRLFGAVAF